MIVENIDYDNTDELPPWAQNELEYLEYVKKVSEDKKLESRYVENPK